MFQNLSFLLPVKVIYNSKQTIGFYHPVPSYDPHILIVPKKIIRTIFELHDWKIFESVLLAAESIHKSIDWHGQDIALCINGGIRQEVKQVHFHLFPVSNSRISPLAVVNRRTVMLSNLWQCDILTLEDKTIIEILPGNSDSSHFQRLNEIFTKVHEILNILETESGISDKGFSLKMFLSDGESELSEKINIEF
jgi:diadenosine tetraphosphate (Ap4A) HIT family hydrolase